MPHLPNFKTFFELKKIKRQIFKTFVKIICKYQFSLKKQIPKISVINGNIVTTRVIEIPQSEYRSVFELRKFQEIVVLNN